MICIKCKKIHDGSFGVSGKFCSIQCSNSRDDDKTEKKLAFCVDCKIPIQVNKRANKEKVLCKKCRKSRICNREFKRTCIMCSKNFITNSETRRTCSEICKRHKFSINRQKQLEKIGTSNFNTKRSNFSYKFVSDFPIDSNLEKAAVIYLVDIFGIEKIEKFKNIISFKEGEYHRTFNPDFYVKKNGQVYIVEVKMRWCNNSEHIYNRNILLKKEALKTFCDKRNFNMIWLDFDYDIQFKKIYNNLK